MVTLRKVDFQSWKRHSLVVKLAKDLFYFLKDVLTFQSDGERIYKFSKVNARRKRSRGVSLPLFLTGRIRSLIFNLCLPLFPFSDPSGKKKKKKGNYFLFSDALLVALPTSTLNWSRAAGPGSGSFCILHGARDREPEPTLTEGPPLSSLMQWKCSVSWLPCEYPSCDMVL